MKKSFTLSLCILLGMLGVGEMPAFAQCGAGYTLARLNWDNIDFLPSNNARYTSFYPSPAFPYNQNFALGTRRLNMVMASSITLNGENGNNAAHTGSFAAAGDDVQFTTTVTANSAITMTFDADVANLLFSLFDLDNSQRVTITAVNGAAAAQTITIARANAGSGITITGSGTTSAVATGPGGGYANNDNNGTINVTIAGPVRQVVITCSNSTGDIWLSDIDACVTGSFPNNYQQISRPFTGQPQYVITVVNNNVYYVDPTNGRGYFLFNEPGHDRLNSMAYDPYRRIVYYTYSLTDRVGLNPQNDKTLKCYNVDTKTISVVIPNVNTFGIPTYESGVESGAASFYNGSLYLGIEGYTGTSGSGAYAAARKSTVWKIDFDAAGNPVPPATQVWGVTADDGTNAQNIHDWSDFGVSNGVLTDFDGSQSGQIDFYQTSLMTGVRTNYTPSGVIPRQVSIGWDERLYNVDAAISLYNGTNGVGTQFNIVAPLGPVIPIGASVASWGDAAGPYRPFLDFGDAPATYDPNPLSPACHDTLTPTVSGARTRMRLGPNEDVEWLKRGFTTVEDNFEDGLAFVPIFSSASGSYLAQVSVFNNSGAAARLCAWLDFNGNGFFDAAEAIVPINVPSSPATQLFWMNWPSTPSSLPSGANTYLRIRITSAAYGMTSANSTGYYDMGEVEDYRVIVDNTVLGIPLLTFDAAVKEKQDVTLRWSANETEDCLGYVVQRKTTGTDWECVGFVSSKQMSGIFNYDYTDYQPYDGTSSYRVIVSESNGLNRFSSIRSVKITEPADPFSVYPNPATSRFTLTIRNSHQGETLRVTMSNVSNGVVMSDKFTLNEGMTTVEIPVAPSLPAGIYFVQATCGKRVFNKKIIVRQ